MRIPGVRDTILGINKISLDGGFVIEEVKKIFALGGDAKKKRSLCSQDHLKISEK